MLTNDDLRKWREARGMSQNDLAAKLGVDQSTVSRIERGELEPSSSVKIIFNAIIAPISAVAPTQQERGAA